LESPRFAPDGLLGLGFQGISAYNAQPVLQTLVANAQTTEPVFGFKLASCGSELYIGGTNSALYSGDFTYTPVMVKVDVLPHMSDYPLNIVSGLLAN